jgi:translation initiation factor 2D
MLQGVITPQAGLGSWECEDKRAVALPEDSNPFPFAVGSMVVSSASLRETGLKGRGLKLLHHYPDTLWAMGDKMLPDASFTPERVFPLGAAPPPSAPPPEPAAVPAAALTESLRSLAVVDAGPAPIAASDPSAPSSDSTATPEGMDAMLDWCLLRGLVDKVPDSELPIKCEELYSKVILPVRPPGSTVDIKKSGYKKIAKMYATWEKKGLLTLKAVHKIDNVTAVNRSHPAYAAAAAAFAAVSGDMGGGESGAGSSGSSAPPQAQAHIQVDVLYRSPSSLRPVFGDLLKDNKERLLSEGDCAAALAAYAQSCGLSKDKATLIVLDELLAGSLYGKKETESVGTPVEASRLLARLLVKLNLFTRLRITRVGGGAPEEVLQKGSIKNIKISAEDRHAGRKHLTRVVGVEAFAIDPDEISSRIQKQHNTSCSVAPLPGKNETGKEVAAQGNLLEEVAAMLKLVYGIPDEFVETHSKCH